MSREPITRGRWNHRMARAMYAPLMMMTLSMLGAVAINAASIPVVNFSFESPAVSPGAFTNSIPGWTLAPSALAGVFNPLATELAAPTDGQQVGYINLGSISQGLAATLVANSLYTLTVDFLSRKECCPWPGSELDLMAGNTVLAFGTISTLAAGSVQTNQVQFTALSGNPLLGQPLAIRIVNTGAAGAGSQIDFDNVRLDGTAGTPPGAPEPMSIGFASVGLLLIAVGRFRESRTRRQRA